MERGGCWVKKEEPFDISVGSGADNKWEGTMEERALYSELLDWFKSKGIGMPSPCIDPGSLSFPFHKRLRGVD